CRDTSFHTAGFIFVITGTYSSVYFITLLLTHDWPINFGCKPFFSFPAWILIMFFFIVMFSTMGLVLLFCLLFQFAPFVKKDHFNPRSTDDTFVMVLECTDKTNDDEMIAFLNSLGAQDVSVQHRETGWWLGRYDRDTVKYGKKI